MICSNNNYQCREQGYCNCYDPLPEASAGSMGLLALVFVGVFAAFLYPALKILRSERNFDEYHRPNFAGTKWLFLSPIFGFLANTLYQIIFAAGACAAGALQSKMTNYIYVVGAFTIYFLATALALLAFSGKNFEAIKLFFKDSNTRSIRNVATVAGIGLLLLYLLFTVTKIAFVFSEAYSVQTAGNAASSDKQQKLIADESWNFERYVGRYKLITRQELIVFVIRKDASEKALRLSLEDKSNSEKSDGCLLTPTVNNETVVYIVSDCVVDGKTSPLDSVSFSVSKKEVKMHFTYSIESRSFLGDDLQKIN